MKYYYITAGSFEGEMPASMLYPYISWVAMFTLDDRSWYKTLSGVVWWYGMVVWYSEVGEVCYVGHGWFGMVVWYGMVGIGWCGMVVLYGGVVWYGW